MGGAVYLRTMGERRRYGRRAALRGAGMAGATALLAACGGDNDRNSTGARTPATDVAAASPKMGGVLREATAVQSPHFSPFHPGADMSFVNYWRRVYGYYDYLWTFKDVDIAERLHLMLASSTEQPDPTTVIVKLTPSRFHDRAPANGREVTADDVVETVRFLSKPPASGGQFLQSGKDLKSVTATDLSSVRFEMFGPRAFFYEELQGGIDLGKPIVPKEMLDEKTLKEAIPVGSGPYEYLRHTQGSSEAMRSFDSYRVNEQPYITERTVVFLPDAAAIEVGFRGNQIDTIR